MEWLLVVCAEGSKDTRAARPAPRMDGRFRGESLLCRVGLM